MKPTVHLLSSLVILAALATGVAQADDSQTYDIDEVWVTMPDGVRLAADVYRPAGAKHSDAFPVLLEYSPYRKNESRRRNYSLYSYFLDNDYIVVRVDIRGTGRSEGVTIPYEYSDIEHDDGEVVIDWLSKQEWSTGNVGMFGISWGGFNSIQMAMRNPPALKAFVAMMATEYLYQEDVHYMDGIMHTDSWMMSHDLEASMPGAPEFILDDEWLEQRFNREPSVYTYMRNQRDGPFWDRASAKGQYEKIKVPGYHIGGWYDGYRNSLPRMLEHVDAPVKAMIGPWDHVFPHDAWPEPSVEWRHEAVRWFDHWLKGEETGILDEPDLMVYVRDYHAPDPDIEFVPGRWRYEDGWPIKRTDYQNWFATADHGLAATADKSTTHTLDYKPSVGLEGGSQTMWWGSVPPDQQPMDDDSLVYDSAPLEAPLEILGRPIARLNVSADATRANWVVRISDVAPDGQVTQVAGAAFNGTHRNSARDPEDLVPGEVFPLEIETYFTSWVFPKGHRIRVAISNGQWPMLWPTRELTTTNLAVGSENGAHVILPVIPAGEDQRPDLLEPAENPVLAGYKSLESGTSTGYASIRSIERDPETGEAFGVAKNARAVQFPWGIKRFDEIIEHRTSDSDPAHTSVVGRYTVAQELEDRTLEFEQKVEFVSDADNFYLTFHRWVKEDGEIFAEKSWRETIARDFQ